MREQAQNNGVGTEVTMSEKVYSTFSTVALKWGFAR